MANWGATFFANTTPTGADNTWDLDPSYVLEKYVDLDTSTYCECGTGNPPGTTIYRIAYETGGLPEAPPFANIASVDFRCSYNCSATPADSTFNYINARMITPGGGTVLAALNSGGTDQEIVAGAITTTTVTDSGNVTFTYVNTTADRPAWASAVLELIVSRTRNKGGESVGLRIHSAEISAEYTAVATPNTQAIVIG